MSTKVGYTQGHKGNPKYREVCSGSTGHTEAVAVDFDPSVVSYEALVEKFWERLGGSALTLNRAGNDTGTQYRSGIYWLNDEQREVSEATASRISASFGKPVVTEVLPAGDKPFYLAEDYHQEYLAKGGQSKEKNDTTPIRCYG
jgi:peptide-methionine (S)-S-oxide reductase